MTQALYTVASGGHYIQLWDNKDVFKRLFLRVEDAAKGWDGSKPVRALPL